jgi:hypothetical protein
MGPNDSRRNGLDERVPVLYLWVDFGSLIENATVTEATVIRALAATIELQLRLRLV